MTDAKMVRLNPSTHARLKEHCRDGETLSGAVDRALDAVDREDELPEAVTALMNGDNPLLPVVDMDTVDVDIVEDSGLDESEGDANA